VRILALGGAGAVCKEATKDLAQFSDFDEIVVADYNVAAAEALVQEIGDPRLSVLAFDANDYDQMLHVFPQFDVVMNGLPFRFDLPVNRACVEVGVNGLDVSSEDPQFALHEQALAKGMTFIPGMGATPGITNVMARRGIEYLDRVEEIDISFAAFRCLAPAPGLLLTTLWEFTPAEAERQEVYYVDGEWHPAPPLSGERLVRFHDLIGEQPVYYVPHDEVYTLPCSVPGIRQVTVRGCFPPHVMRLMGALMEGGLLSDAPVKIGNEEVTAHEAVRALLWAAPETKENPTWAYGLVVEVMGEREGREVKCTYRNSHPSQEEWGGPSAYFKNIGIPLSIGAQMLAAEQVEAKGVISPEVAIPTQPFFNELAKRGIQVHEKIEERQELGKKGSKT
jgi:lysine 6-dehydrogenase